MQGLGQANDAGHGRQHDQAIDARPAGKGKHILDRAFFARIETSAAAPADDDAANIALVYAYVKMQDRDSAVMLGEQATVQNTPNVPDTVRQMYNRLVGGGRLLPDKRQQILEHSKRLFNQTLRTQLDLEGEYEKLAGLRNIQRERIVVDYLGRFRPKSSGGGKVTGGNDLRFDEKGRRIK